MPVVCTGFAVCSDSHPACLVATARATARRVIRCNWLSGGQQRKVTTLAGERTCRCGCQFRKSPAGWIETIAAGSSRSPNRGYPLVSSRRNKWSVCSRIRTQFTVFAIFDKMIIKDPQSRFQWRMGFRPQNGVNVALDHMYDSHYFVVVGIGQWPHDGRSHSYPAGYRHRRGAGPGHSRTKTIVAIWTLPGEGEVFGKVWESTMSPTYLQGGETL